MNTAQTAGAKNSLQRLSTAAAIISSHFTHLANAMAGNCRTLHFEGGLELSITESGQLENEAGAVRP